MNDCIFCKIGRGEIPAPKLHDDADCFAVADIQPQAKKHFLVIPKEHVASLEHALPAKQALVGKLLSVATELARTQGLLPAGFRTVINTNDHGGQTVHHLHVHILGGEKLKGSFA